MNRRKAILLTILVILVTIVGGIYFWQPFFSTKKIIETQGSLLYTDSSIDENYLGYSVPGWVLSVQLPPNLKGVEGIFSLQNGDNEESLGVELRILPNLFGGKLQEAQKALIMQYQKMNPGDSVVNVYSQKVLKVDELAVLNGCMGPQVFVEGLDYSPDVVGYQSLCVIGSDVGRTTMLFELVANRKNAKLVEQYKSFYNTVISTFRFSEEDQVRVISPNGGDIFRQGDIVNIKWQAPKTKRVMLALRNEEGENIGKLHGFPIPNAGEFILTATFNTPPGKYKVHIFICPDVLMDKECWYDIESLRSYGYDVSDNFFVFTSAQK